MRSQSQTLLKFYANSSLQFLHPPSKPLFDVRFHANARCLTYHLCRGLCVERCQTSNVKRQTSNVKRQTSNVKRTTFNFSWLACVMCLSSHDIPPSHQPCILRIHSCRSAKCFEVSAGELLITWLNDMTERVGVSLTTLQQVHRKTSP